jgi:hypothetical protein
MKISSLSTGTLVKAGYSGEGTLNKFLGFTDNTEVYTDKPVFSSLAELKKAKGAKNYKDLEEIQKQAPKYGQDFYAVFHDIDGDYIWCAYLWKNAWRVGTSADRLQLSPATEKSSGN